MESIEEVLSICLRVPSAHSHQRRGGHGLEQQTSLYRLEDVVSWRYYGQFRTGLGCQCHSSGKRQVASRKRRCRTAVVQAQSPAWYHGDIEESRHFTVIDDLFLHTVVEGPYDFNKLLWTWTHAQYYACTHRQTDRLNTQCCHRPSHGPPGIKHLKQHLKTHLFSCL